MCLIEQVVPQVVRQHRRLHHIHKHPITQVPATIITISVRLSSEIRKGLTIEVPKHQVS